MTDQLSTSNFLPIEKNLEMITLVNAHRWAVLIVTAGMTLGLAGCGQKAADPKAEAAAFAGDPVIKAQMGAKMRAEAEQKKAQAGSSDPTQLAAQARAAAEARNKPGAPSAPGAPAVPVAPTAPK